MKTQSHTMRLDDGWILDAASGAAPRAVQVLADCHGSMNSEAGAALQTAEHAFGAMLETAPGVPLSPASFDAVSARLCDPVGPVDEASSKSDWLPKPLVRALARSGEPQWRKRFGGYSEIIVSDLCEPGVRARLLSIPKGKGAPEHDHEGEEFTLVLSGSFTDGRGRYGPGDACVAEPGVVHRPRVDDDELCLCFAVELGAWRLTNPALSALERLLSLKS